MAVLGRILGGWGGVGGRLEKPNGLKQLYNLSFIVTGKCYHWASPPQKNPPLALFGGGRSTPKKPSFLFYFFFILFYFFFPIFNEFAPVLAARRCCACGAGLGSEGNLVLLQQKGGEQPQPAG